MTRAWRIAFVAVLSACGPRAHEHADSDHPHGESDARPDLSFTHWTEQTELFMELPALVRGQESACAAHVTQLPTFAALPAGRVSVVLRGRSGEERFEVTAATVPGIFRPVVKPSQAGVHHLRVEIRAEQLESTHDLGDVTVYESVDAAKAAPAPEQPSGRIPFLKEQQWPIEFATEVISERAIRPSLRVTGVIRARSDADVIISAPVAGRVATSGHGFPQLGQRTAVGDSLAVIAPRLEAADLASLELAVRSGQLELDFAERERARLETLHAEGAVPERRAQAAAHTASEARATLSAAQSRLDQFKRVERSAGRGESTVELRAPLAGTVTAVTTAPGTFVEAGMPLFRVTDLTQLWLEARVPASDIGKVEEPRGASFRIEGSGTTHELAAEALITRGHIVDPATQSLPILFAIDNASGQLPVGAFCRVLLFSAEPRRALALPSSALIDDAGISVVFVQVEGESFERRPIRIGAADGGFVEVLSGVTAGERVVARGAWSVKLAASSGSIPAHGHSH